MLLNIDKVKNVWGRFDKTTITDPISKSRDEFDRSSYSWFWCELDNLGSTTKVKPALLSRYETNA